VITWAPTGTLTISRTETAELTGTLTISEDPTVYINGTLVVNRASVAAWAAQVRRTATRIFLGEAAEDMLRIQGPISITLDDGSLLPTASFQLTDPRCAFFHANSVVTGGLPVSIRCRIATELAETDDTVFRGYTEAAPSSGAYVPTATIQCASEGAEWLTEKGCLDIPPFSGKSRLTILGDLAESVGILRTRIRGGETWATPHIGMSLSGLSPYELAMRFAALEDAFIRLEGGDLVILPASEVVGPAAVSVFDFEPGSFFSASETPPNRPISRLVLSAIGIPAEVLAGGTEETVVGLAIDIAPDGTRTETRTYTTTINGAITHRRVEVWKDAAIPGVTPSAVAFRLWQLTETDTTWGTVTVDGVPLLTARVASERTTKREWFSPPCRTSSGYVWAAPDGNRHIASSATWQVTDDRITTYVYDSDCILTSKTVNVGQWYSELVASGHTYDDGAVRADVSYPWIAPDPAQPWQRDTEVNAEETSDATNAVSVTTRHYAWAIPPGSAALVEEWRAVTGRDDRWSTVPGGGVIIHAWTEYREDGSTHSEVDPPVAGTLPVLVRASATIPQYRTKPIQLEAIADRVAALSEPVVEPAWGAESMDDLINAARHRFRDERSPRSTIRHRANPHLGQYDVVTVTDPTWQHDERTAYVAGYAGTYDASATGALNQDTVVVFPLAAYDPGVPLEVA
jgi:hypothetical protein